MRCVGFRGWFDRDGGRAGKEAGLEMAFDAKPILTCDRNHVFPKPWLRGKVKNLKSNRGSRG